VNDPRRGIILNFRDVTNINRTDSESLQAAKNLPCAAIVGWNRKYACMGNNILGTLRLITRNEPRISVA